jgi:hypothetical protein
MLLDTMTSRSSPKFLLKFNCHFGDINRWDLYEVVKWISAVTVGVWASGSLCLTCACWSLVYIRCTMKGLTSCQHHALGVPNLQNQNANKHLFLFITQSEAAEKRHCYK